MVITAHKPMNAVLYLRVSSEDQVKNFSLDTQLDICTTAAERMGYKIIQVFREEGASAKTANRPELIKLLEYCRANKNNINSVLVYKIDRMARETSDYLSIKKKLLECGIKLESATEPTGTSPVETFVETLLAANAQLDNEIRGERARNGMHKKFQSGVPMGHPPLGYKRVMVNNRSTFCPDNPTFDVIRKFWTLMGTGTVTLVQISKIMNEHGVTVRGKPITKQYASKLFKKSTYAGFICSPKYPGEEVDITFEPMITRELYYRVQGIIRSRRTRPDKTQRVVTNPLFPLRGHIYCFHCLKPYTAGSVRGRSKLYPKYWCQNCEHSKSVSSEMIDNQLKQLLRQVVPAPEAVDYFEFILRATYQKRIEQFNEIRKTAEKDVLELKATYSRLIDTYLSKMMTEEMYNEQRIKIEDKIDSAKIVANDSLCDKLDVEGMVGFMRALFKDLPKAYEVSSLYQKKMLIGSIYPTGLLCRDGELLNHKVSKSWQSIREFATVGVASSRSERN